MLPQDVVGAPAHNDTGAFRGGFFDDVRLDDEQLVVDGHFVDAGHPGTKGIAAHHHGVQEAAGGLLIHIGEHLLGKPAFFCGQGDELFVIKGEFQALGQLFPHFVASAAELA